MSGIIRRIDGKEIRANGAMISVGGPFVAVIDRRLRLFADIGIDIRPGLGHRQTTG
jgi:hypothetical protein